MERIVSDKHTFARLELSNVVTGDRNPNRLRRHRRWLRDLCTHRGTPSGSDHKRQAGARKPLPERNAAAYCDCACRVGPRIEGVNRGESDSDTHAANRVVTGFRRSPDGDSRNARRAPRVCYHRSRDRRRREQRGSAGLLRGAACPSAGQATGGRGSSRSAACPHSNAHASATTATDRRRGADEKGHVVRPGGIFVRPARPVGGRGKRGEQSPKHPRKAAHDRLSETSGVAHAPA